MLPINDLRRHNGAIADMLREAIDRVLTRGWFVLGPELQRFESAFAAYCGTEHCVGVANGTDALELALRVLGIGPGDAVATVANAGMYATTAIRAVGARPAYVDIERASHLLSDVALRAALRAGARAVIVTHLYGRMADMASVLATAREAGVPVIEDCAQAHGARRDGRRAGSLGTLGCFSFYPTKNLGALGDGGAVVTRDAALAEQLRVLRQYGWSVKYTVTRSGGRNSRLDEMQAAILDAKLALLDGWNARRRAVAAAYGDGITHPALTTPGRAGDDDVAHLYVIRTRARDALRKHLSASGIATDVHYPVPDHRQPAFASPANAGGLEETERACGEVLTLPCFPEMTRAEVASVVDACNAWEG